MSLKLTLGIRGGMRGAGEESGALVRAGVSAILTFDALDGTGAPGALSRAADTPSLSMSAVDASGSTGGTPGPFDDWSFYYEVTSDSTQVDADETNPVVWFDLRNAPATFWDNVASDGKDVVVGSNDGATRYPAYVLFIDTVNEKGLVAARVPALTAASDDTYRMYVGNVAASTPAVSDTFGRNNVFQDYHTALNMTRLISSAVEDMTGNGRGSNVISGVTEGTTGWFGSSLVSDGAPVTDGMTLNNQDDFASFDQVCISWVQVKTGGVASNQCMWGVNGANRIRLQTGTYKLRLNGAQYAEITPVDNVEEHYALNFNHTTTRSQFFKNGAPGTENTSTTEPWPDATTILDFNVFRGTQTTDAFQGTGALLLVKTTTRTAAAIKTERNMMVDSGFWTWGTAQAN